MPGYQYLTGVGGGQNQGGTPQSGFAQMPSPQMQSPNLFGNVGLGSPMSGMSGGGMGGGFNPSGLNPSTQAQYQQNSTFVPGFGYIGGNNFTNQSLNSNYIQNPQYANTPMASINAINQQMGGYQLGSTQAGIGGLSGVQTNYGYLNPSIGGGNGLQGLGQSFQFGGQQYAGTQPGISQALSNYNGVTGGLPTLGNGQTTSLSSAYQGLAGESPYINSGQFGSSAQSLLPYFSDPSYSQYTQQTYGGISPYGSTQSSGYQTGAMR